MKKMSKSICKNIFICFLLVTFAMGFFMCLSPSVTKNSLMAYLRSDSNDSAVEEGFDTQQEDVSVDPQCPDLLVKQGNKLMLVHSKSPKSENNPMYFNSLSEYISHVEKQRQQGLRCPILFLQEENNTQGETVYRMRQSPTNMNAGGQVLPTQIGTSVSHPSPLPPSSQTVQIMDASISGNVFNKDMYPGFDSHGTYVGVYTTLDEIHDMTESGKISDNPMDTNCGGVLHSQQAVDSGKYDDRVVGKQTMVPKVI